MILTKKLVRHARRRQLGPNMGDVDALVIGARTNLRPGRLWALGMAGIGAPAQKRQSIADALTGGKVTELSGKLDALTVGLKVAIASSVFAGAAALAMVVLGRRRR